MKSMSQFAGLLITGVLLSHVALTHAQSNQGSVKPAVVKKVVNKKSLAKKTSTPVFAPQSDEIKLLAQQFKGGTFQCEFDNSVTIAQNLDHPGYISLKYKNTIAQMLPVPTNTGALRLESKSGGLVWLQLPSKSMLMNSKVGQRLADDCQFVQ